MKTTAWIFLIAAVFCASPAYALQKGQNLSSARAELLRDGWRPLETFLKFKDGDLQRLSGDSGTLFNAGYPETEYCSGTGSNICFFNYEKGLQCLRLSTRGELSRQYEPKVQDWSNECPAIEGAPDVVRKGKTLTSVRDQLLFTGWRLVTTDFKVGDRLEHSSGAAGALFKAGYTEVETCNGTGSPRCTFNYKKGQQCGRLITEGDMDRELRREPIAISWSNECPPEGAYSK